MTAKLPSAVGCLFAMVLYFLASALASALALPLLGISLDFWHHLWCNTHQCEDKTSFISWPEKKKAP